MQFRSKLTRETIEKGINNFLKVDFFYERYIENIYKSKRKISQQDWILDMAVPVSIFASVVVIISILVLLNSN